MSPAANTENAEGYSGAMTPHREYEAISSHRGMGECAEDAARRFGHGKTAFVP